MEIGLLKLANQASPISNFEIKICHQNKKAPKQHQNKKPQVFLSCVLVVQKNDEAMMRQCERAIERGARKSSAVSFQTPVKHSNAQTK
jgi:hypothetical protein